MAALCATTTAWYFVPSKGAISQDEVDLLQGSFDLSIIRMDPLAHGRDTSINIRCDCPCRVEQFLVKFCLLGRRPGVSIRTARNV